MLAPRKSNAASNAKSQVLLGDYFVEINTAEFFPGASEAMPTLQIDYTVSGAQKKLSITNAQLNMPTCKHPIELHTPLHEQPSPKKDGCKRLSNVFAHDFTQADAASVVQFVLANARPGDGSTTHMPISITKKTGWWSTTANTRSTWYINRSELQDIIDIGHPMSPSFPPEQGMHLKITIDSFAFAPKETIRDIYNSPYEKLEFTYHVDENGATRIDPNTNIFQWRFWGDRGDGLMQTHAHTDTRAQNTNNHRMVFKDPIGIDALQNVARCITDNQTTTATANTVGILIAIVEMKRRRSSKYRYVHIDKNTLYTLLCPSAPITPQPTVTPANRIKPSNGASKNASNTVSNNGASAHSNKGASNNVSNNTVALVSAIVSLAEIVDGRDFVTIPANTNHTDLIKQIYALNESLKQLPASVSAVPSGGAANKRRGGDWVRVRGRVATLQDGSRKALWKNSATGEMRVKKMVLRKGKRVATYVRPA